MRKMLVGTGIGVVLGGILGLAIAPQINFLPTLSETAILAVAGGFIGFGLSAKP